MALDTPMVDDKIKGMTGGSPKAPKKGGKKMARKGGKK